MSLNLGIEALVDNRIEDVSIEEILIAQEELSEELSSTKQMLDQYAALTNVLDVIHQHGGYAGFESLITDKAVLDQIVGFDICTASNEQIANMFSNENISDSLNRFGAKLTAALGRVGDRLSNFIKTTLPYKEKYLREMTELKTILSGKTFNEEKLAEKRIASALSKAHYKEFVTKHNELLKALHKAASESSPDNIDSMIRKMEEHPDVVRGWFITHVNQPWMSWFTKDSVKGLGYTGKDVVPVIDAAIDAIKKIVDLHMTYVKMNEQINRLETQISQDRATGKVEDAVAKRKAVANLQNFFFTMCEAAGVYDITTRRLMYFATYLGRAAKDCIA